MSEVKLLPCPFCHREACMDGKSGSWGYYPATAFVRCGKCNARGPTFHDDDEGGSRNYRAEAAAAWNRRAENERLRAEVAEYANMVQGYIDTIAEADAQAERLAEALQELVEVFSESGMYDEEVFAKARAALDQDGGKGGAGK